MSERPLVSVVVPVRDGEAFLDEALDSVAAQDWGPVETIVVDDGSKDGSAALVRSRDVRLFRTPGGGPAAARNAGVEAARGELVAFLDQDDVWPPESLRRRAEALLARPEVGFVLGRMEVFLQPGAAWPDWLDRTWRSEARVGFCPGTLLVRRETFEQVGPFDESFRSASDAEWLVRARRAGVRGHVLDDVVLRYRIHERNQSHDRELFRTELFRALSTRGKA